jgi:hypothetical protein
MNKHVRYWLIASLITCGSSTSIARVIKDQPPQPTTKVAQPLSKTKVAKRLPEVTVNIGRLSDTLVAIAPGILLHGAGHWYRGDFESSKKILYLEGISVISLIAGYSMEQFVDQSSPITRSGTQWLYHMGGVLFLTTWLADIVGSFRGDQSQQLGVNKRVKSQFSSGYRYQSDTQKNLNHHLVAQLKLSTPSWSTLAAIDWESEGKLAGISAEIEHRLVSYLPQHILNPSNLYFGVHFRRWAWLHEDLTQWIIAPFLEGEVALDLISTGLKSFALSHRVSVAWERFDLAPITGQSHQNESLIDYPLILDSGLLVNLNSDLRLNLSIMQDSTLDLRPLNENYFFWKASLNLRQTEQVDLNAKIISGEDWSMWVTVSFNLDKRS